MKDSGGRAGLLLWGRKPGGWRIKNVKVCNQAPIHVHAMPVKQGETSILYSRLLVLTFWKPNLPLLPDSSTFEEIGAA